VALHGEYLQRPSYEFLHTIGEGNVAVCRLTRHLLFDELVVQKTISLLGVPDSLARIEPRILQEVKHDHIVDVREAQYDPDYTAVVAITFISTYYEGGSIYGALTEGHHFSTQTALTLTSHVLEALHFLHVTKTIIHRDIKPSNIVMTADRIYARLGDLGSAADTDADGRVAAAAGSLLYLPPEYAAGSLDVRSDLYSLGMVLLEMLNGAFPYESLSRDEMEHRTEDGKRALPNRYYNPAPWVPPGVARFVRKLVAPNPDQRFSTAAEALRELNRLRYVSWERVNGGGLTGEWRGKWPPTARIEHRREIAATITPITTGRYAGMLIAKATSRIGNRQWRGYASLTRRVTATDERGVTDFFRAVEAAAQAAPVR
jgi:serine/threonine protein kinase